MTVSFIRATVLGKVVIYKKKFKITICKNQLLKTFEAIYNKTDLPEELKVETKTPIILTKNIKITATSRNGSVLILTNSEIQQPEINPTLVKAIAKSYLWNKQILSGDTEKYFSRNSYIKKVINLRFLSLTIIESILNGTQPRGLTVQQLFNIKTLDWNKQMELLNF